MLFSVWMDVRKSMTEQEWIIREMEAMTEELLEDSKDSLEQPDGAA